MKKNFCIYTHTSPSGRVYVGQTNNVRRRWGYNGEHYKNKKKDGTYIQPLFARAINKYGWENFKHKIILEGISKSEADYAEKYLIRWYKIHNLSYNTTDGGEGTCDIHPKLSPERIEAIRKRVRANPPMKGKHHTPEAIAKIIAANRNRVYTPEQKAAMSERKRQIKLGTTLSEESKRKLSEYRKQHPELWIGGWNKIEVHQYDLEGNYITSYPSAGHAAVALNEPDGGKISECIRGKVASALGYIWREEKVDRIDLSKYKIVKTTHGARLYDMSEEGKRKRRNGHGKKVNQYSLDGKYVATFDSVTDAKEALNYNGGGIGKCCQHLPKYQSAAGFLWEYDTVDNRKDKVV